MNNLKKIIVPTDFSECAKNALKAASDIARKCDAEIQLIHVYEKPVWGFAEANVDIIKNRQLHNRIEEALSKAELFPFMAGVRTAKHIFTDIKIHDAVNHSDFSDAGLVVMGLHGISGWKELFIGSNTEKVVRFSDMPVLVIKEWTEHFEIKNMVFASDFYLQADNSFMKIENLAELFSAKVHLLKIITHANFESTFQSNTLMKDFARRFNLTAFSVNIYNDDTVEDGIFNFSKKISADVIAMETHGRTGLAHFINGSIAENIANHLPFPFLSIKMQNETLKKVFTAPTVTEEK